MTSSILSAWGPCICHNRQCNTITVECARCAACRDQADKLPWADEVFISKADFDDKKQRMADLEGQVSSPPMPHWPLHPPFHHSYVHEAFIVPISQPISIELYA